MNRYKRAESKSKLWNINVDSLFRHNKSDYISQHRHTSPFADGKSWVILSDIEQRIKAKIEAVGMPLKEWDINIYRGVLTGLNEAFIIDGKKREELIVEDPKSAEIIRPILRGRDIKRYSYEFADLWIIATFPSLKIDIEQYPAVKNYLLDFGYDRLKQTGDTNARKKTNNKWFETQDSIGYWEDFDKQKIVWGNLNLKASFALAPKGMYVSAPCPMIVPASTYLLAILNSRVADYYIRKLGVTRNGGYFEYKPMFIEQLPVPKISRVQQQELDDLLKENNGNLDNSALVNQWLGQLYGLSQTETEYIDIQQ